MSATQLNQNYIALELHRIHGQFAEVNANQIERLANAIIGISADGVFADYDIGLETALHDSLYDEPGKCPGLSDPLEKITTIQDPITCCICLEDVAENIVQINKCEHKFCRACILTHFETKVMCPVCRVDLSVDAPPHDQTPHQSDT